MPYSSLAQLRAAYDGGQSLTTYKESAALSRRNGKLLDMWNIGTLPAAGTVPVTQNGTLCDSSTTGAMPLRNASASELYLGASGLSSVIRGNDFSSGGILAPNSEVLVHVFDRLWHNGNFSAGTTSRQAFVQPALTRYADGAGVSLWLRWIGSGSGSTTSNLLIEYTNQSNVATSTTVTVRCGVDGISSPGDLWPLGLAGGDSGIRTLTAITMSTNLGVGSYGFVLMRYLGFFISKTPSVPQAMTPFLRGLPLIQNNACLCFALQGPPISGGTTLMDHIYTLTGDIEII